MSIFGQIFTIDYKAIYLKIISTCSQLQVPMNLFLMFMAGSSISIFPIMMVGMMLLRPIKALWATNTTFKSIEGTHAALQVMNEGVFIITINVVVVVIIMIVIVVHL